MKRNLQFKIKHIKALIFDVDGVLTNGQIILDQNGSELKIFNVHDGYGIALLKKAGLRTAILSARSASAVTARAEDLKIDMVCQDVYPKTEGYEKIRQSFGLEHQEICYMGDDTPDICILQKAGLSVAVANAVSDVKKGADYITKKKGGEGAVREVVEMILKGQKKWNMILP